MKKFIVSVIFLVVVVQASLLSQVKDSSSILEVRISARASDTKIPLNRSVKLIVQISWTGGMDTVTVEDIEDPELTNFEITGTSAANRMEASVKGKKSIREITYNLKPESLGMGYIEPVSVTYLEKSTGKKYKVSTRRFGIKVTDAVPDSGKRKFPYVSLLVVVLLVIGGIAFYIISRKKQAVNDENTDEHTPAEEEFLAELKNTIKDRAESLNTILDNLTRIFRKYLSGEFNIRAMEATSSEMIKMLEENGLEENYLKRFEKIFSRADIIKFSGEKASQTDVDDAFAVMEMFIENRLKSKNDDAAAKRADGKNKFNLLARKKTE
ncbi:hypothetical protein J7K93_01660 [bacterium]|nr:hypothetical protein [bacterium]